MKLFVTRHGETNYNIYNKVCGISDAMLTEKGKQQAKEVALKLKEDKIDMIYVSPLTRAKDTANIINEQLHVGIVEDKRLQEIHFGEFEGVVVNEDFRKIKAQNAYRYPGGESLFQVVSRVYNLIDDLYKQYPDKTILLVCHGGIVRVIHSYFHDMTNDELMNWLPENCCHLMYEK